jgi:hypothetical protein
MCAEANFERATSHVTRKSSHAPGSRKSTAKEQSQMDWAKQELAERLGYARESQAHGALPPTGACRHPVLASAMVHSGHSTRHAHCSGAVCARPSERLSDRRSRAGRRSRADWAYSGCAAGRGGLRWGCNRDMSGSNKTACTGTPTRLGMRRAPARLGSRIRWTRRACTVDAPHRAWVQSPCE